MNWRTAHRTLPVRKGRRRAGLHLVAALLALIVLIPRAQTARADGTNCFQTVAGTLCFSYPPPTLLNLNQSLYAATEAQAGSLQILETQAISNTISDHNLSAGDVDAVQSWGRADADAELYGLLVQAINTPKASRTTDQQNAVDWVAAVEQRKAVLAAQDAGLEYAKWAGLDQSQYQSLVNDNAGESALQAFLSQPPEGALNNGGYCSYQAPTPYSTEYNPSTNASLCDSPGGGLGCITSCVPSTPSYDQFVKWGEADASYALLNSSQFSEAGHVVASALGFGLAAGASAAALPLTLALIIGSLGGAGAQAAGSTLLFPFAATASVTVAGFAALAAVVILAITIAVIDAINVVSALKVPEQLASLISNAETTPPDPATLESTTDGATSIFSDFVGATLPTPLNQTCDNSSASSEPGLTVTAGTITIENSVPCLNPTALPAASPTDPQFLVQAKGSTTQTASPTITWKDAAAGTTTTARLSENWFIENESAQTLRIAYTDWNGKEQSAWLVQDKAGGSSFLGFSAPADTSTPVDPTTCVANGICSLSTTIDYIGSDGQDYSASVQGYQPPKGSPTYTTPAVEGSPVSFDAASFAPGSASGAISYAWQFEQPCPSIFTCLTVNGAGPNYSDPVSGDKVTHTWQASGTYHVSLTATDAHGVQANDTFTVAVGDVPPTLQVTPACGSNTLVCTPQTGDVGTQVDLAGTVAYAGSLDKEYVTVDWADGGFVDSVLVGPATPPYALYGVFYPNPHVTPAGVLISPTLAVSSKTDTSFSLSDSHTYTKPGIYHVLVTVSDQHGGSDSTTFTETITGPQLINFPSIPPHAYGDAPFAIAATGGGSGQAVAFASVDPTVCTVSGATGGVDGSGNGTGAANVTVLKPGTCALTASQVGNGIYQPAANVTQTFAVQPAPLTITASSPSITYGGTAPAITAGYSGFVGGDTSSALTTQPTCAVAPNSGAAGTYKTTCADAAAPNYSFTYVPGTLTINQAPLTVTANNKSMTYGGSVPAFDAGYSGFVNGDRPDMIGGLTCGATDGHGNPVSGSTPAGTYSITCSGGTAANYALSYQPGTLTITRANTSLTLAAAPTSSVFGQPVALTASVAVQSPGAGNPGGTVEFKDGSTDIGGCAAQPVSATSETATCTTSALSVATHSITAVYSGDGNFVGSSAAALSQTVTKAASTVTLAPTTPSTQGQPATFTAVVAATAPGAGTPGGTVTFKDGATVLGSGRLSVVGGTDRATFSTASLGVGPHTITVGYGGDGNFAASASAAATQYVNTSLGGYPRLPSGAYNLGNTNLAGGYFVGVSLAGASLTNSILTGAVFTGADLAGANLSNSNLKGATFTGANLSGANLANSNLMGATGLKTATLTNVIWSKTACPDGTLSNNDGGTCVGHL